jgi:phage terminase large subunit GpA-like protein
VNNPKSRRTGDKTMLKEYVGGFLTISSAQAAAKLRSKSIRIMLRDEVDGAPEQLKTGEGNWIDVSEARLDAWGPRGKIFDFSTPTLYHASTIYKLYTDGDRRIYVVPCPYCEFEQELRLGDEKTQYGLKPIKQAGKTIDVVYMCEKCMVSWLKLWRRYERAQDDPDAMRSFMNLSLGLPYKESGNKPKHRELIRLRGAYKSGTIVPNGVLYLVAGVDVQGGSKKHKKENPPRLEMEVMGMGALRQTWSLDYKIFKGPLEDPSAGAWALLKEYIDSFHPDYGKPYRDEHGLAFNIEMVLIDSGDGNFTSVVYSFTQMMRNVYPSKGASQPIQRKRTDPILDVASYSKDKPYERKVFKENNIVLYRINTTHYKSQLYKFLTLSRQKGIGDRGWGYCDFPKNYPDKYFKMLVAEEQREDQSFFCPAGRRNEALDCRVMCLCYDGTDTIIYDRK